jgi:hypothetical protein
MPSLRAAQGKLLSNPSVLQQLTASLLAESYAVLSEGAGVSSHANRLKFANAIIAQPGSVANFMLPALCYNANIAAAANNAPDANGTPLADADVDALVQTIYTAYATQFVAAPTFGVPLQLGS